MRIRLAEDLQFDSIVDGEGLRTVIWTQGCIHNCPGCHNPKTHSFKGGFLVKVSEIKNQIDNLKIQDGLTFSGGEPFCQVDACLEIATYCQKKGLNVWCYTGFTFEELMEMSKENSNILKFLENIDVLVDGRFILEEKSLNLKFRGSRNQRIIDVKKSLKRKKSVLIPKYIEEKHEQNLAVRDKYMFV
jgi:anaerobic ribonucleoside-triphosphate reductase activating protein